VPPTHEVSEHLRSTPYFVYNTHYHSAQAEHNTEYSRPCHCVVCTSTILCHWSRLWRGVQSTSSTSHAHPCRSFRASTRVYEVHRPNLHSKCHGIFTAMKARSLCLRGLDTRISHHRPSFLRQISSSLPPTPTIAKLLTSSVLAVRGENSSVTINGFVRSVRKQKSVAFAAIGDGTTVEPLQAVLSPSQADR